MDAQVPSLPPEATIPSPRIRYASPPPSPSRIAKRYAPDSPSRIGPRIWGCHTPIARKGSLSISRGMSGHGCWMCPVCFFVENSSSNKLCEICTAPNPGHKDSQVLQQCTNCTFANPELSVECQMCGEPLPYGRARRSVRNQQSPRHSKGAPGWDTGGQSDEEAPRRRASRRNREIQAPRRRSRGSDAGGGGGGRARRGHRSLSSDDDDSDRY